MSEFLELEDGEDIPCCPETPEPFPNFSVKSIDDLGPCSLAITTEDLGKLTSVSGFLADPITVRMAVANAFIKHFKIEII